MMVICVGVLLFLLGWIMVGGSSLGLFLLLFYFLFANLCASLSQVVFQAPWNHFDCQQLEKLVNKLQILLIVLHDNFGESFLYFAMGRQPITFINNRIFILIPNNSPSIYSFRQQEMPRLKTKLDRNLPFRIFFYFYTSQINQQFIINMLERLRIRAHDNLNPIMRKTLIMYSSHLIN